MLTAAVFSSTTPFGGTDFTGKIERVYFQVTPANAPSNYPGPAGDTLDLTLGGIVHSGYAPIFVVIQSIKAGGVSGYGYDYLPGTTPANGTMQVTQCAGAGAPMADIGAGNYPAGVLADSIVGYADFLRL